MVIKVKRQIVRPNEKHESYRISLPKLLLQEHDLEDVEEYLISVKKGKIVLEGVR